MENQRLNEIRNRLATLPVLQQRKSKLEQLLSEAEKDMKTVFEKYSFELSEVERMNKESLSNTILRLVGKFEDKLDKETQEMLAAKLEYDKASTRVADLHKEKTELSSRITDLLQNKDIFETELRRREETVKNSITSKAYLVYRKLEDQREKLEQQLVEIDEALRVAMSVEDSLRSAMEHLDSAEGWATFDVWTRGGIFSHMAKYEHIDNASDAFNSLSHQLKDLRNELADLNSFEAIENIGVDSSTRMFDCWFDNIFTDLNVRDKIRADIEDASKLSYKIAEIITRLEESKRETFKEIDILENKKRDLLISNA